MNNSNEYDKTMAIPQQAAVIVLDHVPDADEVHELAMHHLDDFAAEEAHASCDIVYTPPEWLEVHERDQMSAYLRDGAACILVVYMREGYDEDDDEEIDLD